MSYVHFHRAGGANILPINGPQVVNAVANQTDPLDPTFRTTQQGYPARVRRSVASSIRCRANITYMPEDYHSSRVQSYYISVQREIARNMIVDVAYVGNRADDLLLFANFNQADAEQLRRDDPAAGPPADRRSSPTSPTRSTAASRATTACR